MLVAVALLTPRAVEGQITVDRIYPSTVGGGESTITAEGKFPSWPCQVVCDRADVKISPGEESGKLTVALAESAPPGVAWIRLYDDRSASNLIPLLIESSAVTVEKEPNNRVGEANEVDLPAVVTGRLHRRDEVDAFRFEVQAADTLIVSIIANQILKSPMDAVLQIADLRGNVLAQSDDARGLDPQLEYQVAEDAELIVRVFACPETPNSTIGFAGGASYQYQLRITSGPFLDHVSPIMTSGTAESARPVGSNLDGSNELKRQPPTTVSPAIWHLSSGFGWQWLHRIDQRAVRLDESRDSAIPITAESLPILFTGCITEPGQVDRVRFRVSAGKKYIARSYSKSAGYLLDSVLRVVEVDSGRELVRKDDNSRTDFDSRAEFRVKSAGECELQVMDAVDAHSPRHEYAVWLGEDEPSVRLMVAADHFALSAGESLEIPVAISRSGGFAEPLTVRATGLPAGASAEPVLSEAKGDTSKSVKLKVTADKNVRFHGNIRIVAANDAANDAATDAADEAPEYSATHALRPAIDLANLWLTISPKK